MSGDRIVGAYAAGRWWEGTARDVRSPYDGRLVGRVHEPGADALEAALVSAVSLFETGVYPQPHVRATALRRLADAVERDADEFVDLLVHEAGKPRRNAPREVHRAIGLFRACAAAATLATDTGVDLTSNALSGDRYAIVRHRPRGVVLGITPANAPLNLVAHKIGPAVAVGAPVIVKPHERTPLIALRLAKAIHELDLLPEGAVSVLPAGRAESQKLAADERVAMISFTGGEVGWELKAANPRKHVTLELGGNAAIIVAADADPTEAARLIADGAFGGAGQSCISVQRALIHESIYESVESHLVSQARLLRAGNPDDRSTVLGPLVEPELERIGGMVDEAVRSGARVLTGGARNGSTYEATVMRDVPRDAAAWRREVFGPVVSLMSFATFDEAIEVANDTSYGLHAALLTQRLDLISEAYRRLRVGGLVVGDSTEFRDDRLPYGGVRASGYGREGVRAAMEEMTEPGVLVLTGVSL